MKNIDGYVNLLEGFRDGGVFLFVLSSFLWLFTVNDIERCYVDFIVSLMLSGLVLCFIAVLMSLKLRRYEKDEMENVSQMWG